MSIVSFFRLLMALNILRPWITATQLPFWPRVFVGALIFSRLSAAAGISFNLFNPSQFATPGTIVSFVGTVTNNTAMALNTTDMFFNFSAFDPTVLNTQQLLGNPDFVVQSGATSAAVNLFSLGIDSSAVLNQTYGADVFLQDVTGNESDIASVSVTIITPEPATMFLLGTGLGVVAFLKKKARAR